MAVDVGVNLDVFLWCRLQESKVVIETRDGDMIRVTDALQEKKREVEVLQDCLMSINESGRGVESDTLDEFDAVEQDPDILG